MKKVEAIFRPDRLAALSAELEAAGFRGFTIFDVRGHGKSPESLGEWRGQAYELQVTHKLQIEIIVDDAEVESAVAAIMRGSRTGAVGDGLIVVSELSAVYQIRGNGSPSAAKETPAGKKEDASRQASPQTGS